MEGNFGFGQTTFARVRFSNSRTMEVVKQHLSVHLSDLGGFLGSPTLMAPAEFRALDYVGWQASNGISSSKQRQHR